MSRLSAMLVVLVAFIASFASAQLTICHVTGSGDLATFQTLEDVTDEEYYGFEPENIMLGPCNDWLGEICADDDPCSVDYDIDAVKCLPFPRAVVAGCELE